MNDQARLIGALIGSIGIGFLMGLIPLIYGITKGKAGLGAAGLVACLASGFLLGILLAAPVAGLMTWVIARQAPPKQESDPWAS